MVSNSASQFSLYNFFSVLLPGVIFLAGLYPLLPEAVSFEGVGILLPILGIGFAIGQSFHIFARGMEDVLSILTHRERFKGELNNPTLFDNETIDVFYQALCQDFPHLNLPSDREDLGRTEALYVHIRAKVDIESSGRTQIFQAIYAFCRSMCFMCAILGAIYVLYGIQLSIDPASPLPYPSKLGAYNLQPLQIQSIVVALSVSGTYLFGVAFVNYRDFFIQYLVSEYLLLIDLDSATFQSRLG